MALDSTAKLALANTFTGLRTILSDLKADNLLVTNMNTASKLGPHTQTDRGTCPGVGL
jgi:hypothetical protein